MGRKKRQRKEKEKKEKEEEDGDEDEDEEVVFQMEEEDEGGGRREDSDFDESDESDDEEDEDAEIEEFMNQRASVVENKKPSLVRSTVMRAKTVFQPFFVALLETAVIKCNQLRTEAMLGMRLFALAQTEELENNPAAPFSPPSVQLFIELIKLLAAHKAPAPPPPPQPHNLRARAPPPPSAAEEARRAYALIFPLLPARLPIDITDLTQPIRDIAEEYITNFNTILRMAWRPLLSEYVDCIRNVKPTLQNLPKGSKRRRHFLQRVHATARALWNGTIPADIPQADRDLLRPLFLRFFKTDFPLCDENVSGLLPLLLLIQKKTSSKRQLLPLQTAIVPSEIPFSAIAAFRLVQKSKETFTEEETKRFWGDMGSIDTKRTFFAHILTAKFFRKFFPSDRVDCPKRRGRCMRGARCPQTDDRRLFSGSFTTDAVRVSFHFSVSEKKAKSSSTQATTRIDDPKQPLDDATRAALRDLVIVAIDIGKSCLLQAVALAPGADQSALPEGLFNMTKQAPPLPDSIPVPKLEEKTGFRYWRYTMGQRIHETKSRELQKTRNSYARNVVVNGSTVATWESVIAHSGGSARSLTTAGFALYVREKLWVNLNLQDHFYNFKNKVYRRMRLWEFSNRQSADVRLLKSFVRAFGSPECVCVVLGNFSSGSYHMHGFAPQRGVGWRRFFARAGFKTFIADEFSSSKRCAACRDKKSECIHSLMVPDPRVWHRADHGQHTQHDHHGVVPESERPKVHCHGLLHCNKCNVWWDRDKNGARNILIIALSAIAGRPRPEYLAHPRRRQQKKQQQKKRQRMR